MPRSLASIAGLVLVLASVSFAQADAERGDRQEAIELSQQTRRLVAAIDRLEARNELDEDEKAELTKMRAAFDDLIDRFEGRNRFSYEHFLQVSSAILSSRPEAAIRIAEAGLQRYPDARFLYDHVGMARQLLAHRWLPCKKREEALRSAVATFSKALELEPDTPHAHIGLLQLHRDLDEPEKALEQLQAAVALPGAEEMFPQIWAHHAALLLQAGRAKDALAHLDALPEEQCDSPFLARHLRLRAHALLRDLKTVRSEIRSWLAEDGGDDARLAAADALLYLDKGKEALKILDDAEWTRQDDESEDRFELRKQAAAAMQILAAERPLRPGTKLREKLTEVLDHHFFVLDSGPDGKPMKHDLSNSPRMMALLLSGSRSRDLNKAWANDILAAFCLLELPHHRPGAAETKFAPYFEKQGLPRLEDLESRLQSLRHWLGRPGAPAALTCRRIAEMTQKEAQKLSQKKSDQR